MAVDEEKIYGILLDLQKQIGSISKETGEQTEKLKSIDEQVKKTNGRVTKLEGDTSVLKNESANSKERNHTAVAVFSAFAGVALTVLTAIIIKKLGL